jgi:hypothetical protein
MLYKTMIMLGKSYGFQEDNELLEPIELGQYWDQCVFMFEMFL